jgi:hypothetical protein
MTGLGVTKPRLSDESVTCRMHTVHAFLSDSTLSDQLSSTYQLMLVITIYSPLSPHAGQVRATVTLDLYSKDTQFGSRAVYLLS